MLHYILRRLLYFIPTLLIIYTVAFLMMRAAPGSPFVQEKDLPRIGIEQGCRTLSNGRVSVCIRPQSGDFDLIDTQRNEIVVSGAEAVVNGASTSDPQRQNRCLLTTAVTKFGTGKRLTLVSTKPGENEITVGFTLYEGKPFVDISWAVKNLGEEPIRIHEAGILSTASVFPKCPKKPKLRILNGDGGGRKTQIVASGPVRSENNLLITFGREGATRSFVAGGLTYRDFRKDVLVESTDKILPEPTRDSEAASAYPITIRAYDPVGKRVDPGRTYASPDRFYVDFCTDNPFDSLEGYGKAVSQAQEVKLNYYTFPSVCMWFISVKHFGGDTEIVNDTVGAVKEMDNIVKSGFLKYSPVAVRLVPDCYEQNNEQGWWDDKHWQMHGRAERCIVPVNEDGGHYRKPYETSQKWCQAIIERGGIPFTYFQPGIRSEDYAEAFPDHMLFNEAHRYILQDGKRVSDPHRLMGIPGIDGKPGYGKLWQESYDYTDPGFTKRLKEVVYPNLRRAGLKGIFFDYPERALPERGGLEDNYATSSAAYRNVYSLAREGLGPVCYLQERLGPGSDMTLGLIDSQRTEGDNNTLRPEAIWKVALRWYKNRRLISYDMDGKALLKTGPRRQHTISKEARRAVLTISYAITGRLLLTEDFAKFPPEVIRDLGRVFPFHATALSARPIDAFVSGGRPSVFDFPIGREWHQVVLYNAGSEPREFSIRISGDTAFGSLGLDPARKYYVFDFWNDHFAGRIAGAGQLQQTLRPGEARMLAIHSVKDHPQFIATNRHIMQGYVDLLRKPVWDPKEQVLSGVSGVVPGETYRIVLALNGYTPGKAVADDARCTVRIWSNNANIADLIIRKDIYDGETPWRVSFQKEGE